MPARDAAATRRRILDAGLDEFAAHGHAGARVERIAAAADANVRMIYAYHGGKTALFDAVLADAIARMAEAVPPRATDLPGWAGQLVDFHAADPRPLRISLWAQLERPEAAAEPLEAYRGKVDVVSADGMGATAAIDLLTIVYAVGQAWQLTPLGLLGADGSDPRAPERLAAHRAAVVAAVAAISAR